MTPLEQLFLTLVGSSATDIVPLAGAGSNRRYYRLSNTRRSLVGVEGDSVEENRAFVRLSAHFAAQGLPVPQVFAVSADERCYLQTDLGDTSLFDLIRNGNLSEPALAMLRTTIALLPRMQVQGAQGLDFSVCYPQAEFDRRTAMWDLNYFKYCFLKPSELDFSEVELENDFEHFASDLLTPPSFGETKETFLYRDFQSRNVMIHNDEPYFIDFQGGRKGAVYYDVASFLWQAKACFSEVLRRELLQIYLAELRKYTTVDEVHFNETLMLFVLFRTLQVLGAYGFRGLVERKPHFIDSIPYALHNLKELLQSNDFSRYPYLIEILHRLTELPQFAPQSGLCGFVSRAEISGTDCKSTPAKNDLQITVYSFSYKKGIPTDDSGNGGGFVFDCRAIHNPGRYERYKQLTGLDKPVRDFLEADGEILRFLAHVQGLTDASVNRYIERGFTHLQIAFGCTGGQHRSVYCAQYIADRLVQRGMWVRLIHREQQQ